MEVTRTSLRAQRNQVPKQVRQGAQTQQKGGYGEELKQQGQEIFNVRSERPVIQAKRVDPIVSPTEQYTKDAVKTAMEKLKKFVLNQGLGEQALKTFNDLINQYPSTTAAKLATERLSQL